MVCVTNYVKYTAEMTTDLGLLDALVQLSFAVQGALGRIAAEHELSLVQVRLLGILRDREPGMQELAKFLSLDKSSVTGLVDRAERRGLVQRESSSEDGRAVRVSMTEQGRALAQQFVKQMERELGALVEGLSEPDRRRLSVLASQVALDAARQALPGISLSPRKR